MQFFRFLPVAETTGEFQKSAGVKINGTFCRNALVNILFGEKVPARTYTIGVNGRGSLVMEEQEFRDLLASMALLFDTLQPGYVPPKVV